MTTSSLSVFAVALACAACSSSHTNKSASPSSATDAGDRPAPALPLAGCHPDRRALVHHGGGAVISPAPSDAPYSCAVATGQTAYDAVVVVTPKNTVLFSPAINAAVTVSTNNGATWSAPIHPDGPATENDAWIHPWLYRDPASNRIFLNSFDFGKGSAACTDTSGTSLWFSDDEGATWETHAIGCDSKDYGKIITGKPVTAASQAALVASGYPSVVYFCAEGPAVILGPDRFCYRSTDGGKSFVRTKTNAIDDSRGQRGFPGSGAVGADGTVYIAHGADAGLAVAVSQDEGDTWHDAIVTGSVATDRILRNYLSNNVATDEAGNVYATWVDDRDFLPYVSASKDHGATWTAPLMVGTPDVRASAYPNISVKEAGHVAVAYYGSPDLSVPDGGDGYFNSDGRAYDGYLVVTRDLFAKDPVLYSSVINEPGSPVIQGLHWTLSEYLGPPSFAPDGSVWAGYINGGQGLAGRMTPL